MTALVGLPESGDPAMWSEQERALVEAAGLVRREGSRQVLADRPTVEAFLLQCRRTGLDPIGRQIYCICRAGRWQTQVSIDGARLVAERSRGYRGQTPAQWTGDGVVWVDVWLSKVPPAAARVGVHREGFVEPLVAVATMDQYRPLSGAGMWDRMPALMLAKCAEMLALRKAFPHDLSGLYSAEEMAQADRVPSSPRYEVRVPQVIDPVWVDRARAADTIDILRQVFAEARSAGVVTHRMPESDQKYSDFLSGLAGGMVEEPAVDPATSEVTEP